MSNGIPVTWLPILPPPSASMKKLETAPGFILSEVLAGPETVPSETEIVVVSAFLRFVVSEVEDSPLANDTLVVYTGPTSPLAGPEYVNVFTPEYVETTL